MDGVFIFVKESDLGMFFSGRNVVEYLLIKILFFLFFVLINCFFIFLLYIKDKVYVFIVCNVKWNGWKIKWLILLIKMSENM